MPPYRFAESETMTSKEIDAEYKKAFSEKQRISIEKSRIDPKDEEAIRIKRITELKWERKCNWLLEDLDKKLVEERPAREMRELLLRLKTTGEKGIQITNALPDVGTYTGDMHDGKRHGQGTMIYNNKNTYEGLWYNDKMNGRGEFRNNVTSIGTFDWEFYGDFKDNCPISGQVIKSIHGTPTQMDGKPGINIFDWYPYETNQRLEGGEVSAAGAADLRRDIEHHAGERRREATQRALDDLMLAPQKAREKQKLHNQKV